MNYASKLRSIFSLLITEMAVLSLWFVSAATLSDMQREADISPISEALLSSGVQGGFVIGAIISAVLNLADRFDPRKVLAISAIAAAVCNSVLLLAPIGGVVAICTRIATGVLLAGVYPVGMKIAVGWGKQDRGLLVGLLIGALTLGSASPHLVSFLGGADWRLTIVVTSILAGLGGLLALSITLGPYHASSLGFNPRAIWLAWSNRHIRLAYAGYFGHMWELYAMWAWVGVFAAASYRTKLTVVEAESLGKLTAFLAIGVGSLACVAAGWLADKIGKAEIAIIAMTISGAAAIGTALSFGGPIALTFALILIWGIAIVPDSAQFSALVADNAPPELSGSLLSLQTALGFMLTTATVQFTHFLANIFGWPVVIALMALGPAYGVLAMIRLRQIS